ncbi:MAG: hypothetical protein KIT86_10295 [Hydrogenophaga sp.]|uniref:hypothetical protein n=1 Tax=Hydrogenophaga sp. TaxID=1904254 RepID=UPI00261553CF|nr:hypothetical protein [Hydrogenophaga sp.]MCW5670043.1 hypothetical protein [Hydrogenophaga sp.]
MASQSNKTSPKKPKLVRDSFTIPKTEFAAIDQLKTRAIALGSSVKKSELLRAGLMVLQGLNDAAYKAALAAVPTLKTGRPAVTDQPVDSKRAAKTATKPAAPVAAPAPATKAAVKKAVAKKPAPAAKTAPKTAAKRPVARRATPAGKAA